MNSSLSKESLHLPRHFSNGRFVVVTRKEISSSSSNICAVDDFSSRVAEGALLSLSHGDAAHITSSKSCSVKKRGGYLSSVLRLGNAMSGKGRSGGFKAAEFAGTRSSFALSILDGIFLANIVSSSRDCGEFVSIISVAMSSLQFSRRNRSLILSAFE